MRRLAADALSLALIIPFIYEDFMYLGKIFAMKDLTLSFAPMEGVTGHIYRRLHARMFPGADRYYAPFIAPDSSGKFKASGLRDILPENNPDIDLVPQVLCSRPEPFLAVARELAAMGYRELNLNAGCPSGTVVPKRKGAGMLADLRALDDFLAEVFSHCELKVSVKTRMGLDSTGEFPAILEVYNKYPLSALIIHARDRVGMYKSRPDIPAFAAAFHASRAPVCYNGNIFSRAHLEAVRSAVPELEQVMVGRGVAADPALFRRLRGGEALEAEELRAFLARLLDAFLDAGLSERHALARLKELWYYTIYMFPGASSKKIIKAQTVADYRSAVDALFTSGAFSPAAFFNG